MLYADAHRLNEQLIFVIYYRALTNRKVGGTGHLVMGRKLILSEENKAQLKYKITQQSMELATLKSVGDDRGFNLEAQNQINLFGRIK